MLSYSKAEFFTTLPEIEEEIKVVSYVAAEGDISTDLLAKLQKASAVLSLPDLVLESDGALVSLSVRDKKNPSSNQFSEVIMDGDGQTYTMNFKMENIKVVKDEYTVKVSSKGLSQFVAKNKGLEYFIALEPDSVFGS